MSRQDLGFVVGRAVGVMLLMRAVDQFERMSELFFVQQEMKSPSTGASTLVLLVGVCFTLLLALVFWFRADVIAGKRAANAPVHTDGMELGRAILLALGIYLAAYSGANLVQMVWEKLAWHPAHVNPFQPPPPFFSESLVFALGVFLAWKNRRTAQATN